jgi:hypothetical protein
MMQCIIFQRGALFPAEEMTMASQPPTPNGPEETPTDDPIPSPEDPPTFIPNDPIETPETIPAPPD